MSGEEITASGWPALPRPNPRNGGLLIDDALVGEMVVVTYHWQQSNINSLKEHGGMTGFIEHIRTGDGGEPEVLQRSAWSGPALSRDEFREIAFAILNDEGRGTNPKVGGDPSDTSPAPEAIRLVRDDGSEQYRYDLTDLEQDNRTVPRR